MNRGGRGATAALAALCLSAGCTPPAPPPGTPITEGPPAPFFAPPLPEVSRTEVGYRLLAAGENELALRTFAEALARDPVSPEILVGLGSASQRLGRLNQARRYLERAVEIAPGNVLAWNNLGVVRYGLAEYPASAEAFRTAFALDGARSDAIRQNLALAEQAATAPVDADRIAAEFQMVPAGGGRYLLLDRSRPAGIR